MPYLLALSLAVNVTVVIAFLRYIGQRDEREARERQKWANRIQAPELAIAQELSPDEPELVHAIPFDDDEAYWQKRENA